MFFELNVSLNGSHYFATDGRSITDRETATRMAMDFKARFPAKEGFKIMITYYPENGYSADLTDREAFHLIDTIKQLGTH